MKFKILSLFLIFGLMTMNTACTSSNDDSADIEAADGANSELADEGAALDTDSADEGSEVADDSGTSSDDELVDDGTGDAETADVADVDADTDDFAADEDVVADTGDEDVVDDGTVQDDAAAPAQDVAATEEYPADSMENNDSSSIVAEDGTVSDAPQAEEGVFDSAPTEAPQDSSSYASADESSPGDTSGYAEAPKMISVKKIAEAPYTKNGVLVNTVYLGRSGDTLNSIATKIGTTKSELLTANPNLSNGVKVGDKVYYNSPKRPQDSEKMLTYYEDNGLAPQSYVAQAGDNIRTVSKSLLGDSGSWKEVWATNLSVESKDELPAGTELKYWPEGAAAAPAVAATTPVPAVQETPQMPEPAPEAAVAANTTNPAPETPQDDFALPDDTATNGAAAAGTVASAELPPPPPPPAAPQKTVASNDEKDLTFMLSAGGLLLVGVGVLLGIIRKSRSRKMSMNTHTQI